MPTTSSASPEKTAIAGVVERLLARCDELAAISDRPGRISRSFLSPAMERVNQRVAEWMAGAGMHAERDAVGNLIGTYPSRRRDAPVLVLGSHLDTVRDAGRYDGVLGVLLGLAAVEALAGADLDFDLEVVAFADEEGQRFGLPFLGSRGLIGDLGPRALAFRDADGTTVADAIRAWGGEPDAIACRYAGRRTLGFVEAHIEQGPVLDTLGLPVGVLDAITGACWSRLRFEGGAGHAGTTPMALRRDALAGAAEMVLATEKLARGRSGLVATVGELSVAPGSSNVVPGSVELRLDVRHPSDARLDEAMARLLETAGGIARRRRLAWDHEVLSRQAGARADPRLSDLLAGALESVGVAPRRLVVGAGHDAMILARVMPMTMLLIRTPGGLSHHPDEAARPEDIGVALEALLALLARSDLS